MKDHDCVFCKIAAGDIPSATIYEDDSFKVILDISPATKGHAIIIPKNHADNIFEMKTEDASKIFVIATKVAKAMKEVLSCDGLNVLQNNGEIAGQTVFHFHMHLIPRYQKDNVDSVTLSWKTDKYAKGEMDIIAKSIREKL